MKLFVVGFLGLFGGAALAYFALDSAPPGPAFGVADGDNLSEQMPGIESRLAALEEALATERRARQLIEEQLFSLLDAADTDPGAPEGSTETTVSEPRASRAEQRFSRRNPSREQRVARLVNGGFDEATADWILTRESEMQMEEMRMRYEAMRNSNFTPFQRSDQLRNDLTENLGNDGYEQYLVANGRSLNVSVGSVLDSSPAQSAGLRPGDQITSYGGARVYNMNELRTEILQTAPDQRVVVEYLRDGVPMQSVLPSGPVGVTGR
jgi:hypothetical protein